MERRRAGGCYSMKKLFACALGLPALAMALSGCCANNPCDCQDLLEDALYFQFDSTFTAADIDTVYLTRYSAGYGITPLVQAVLVRKARLPYAVHRKLVEAGLDTAHTIVLANNYPFPPGTTGGKINQFTYQLQVREGDVARININTLRPTHNYSIGQIGLRGQYTGDGCCTCYRNTRKTVVLNGQHLDQTETSGQPVPIVLHK